VTSVAFRKLSPIVAEVGRGQKCICWFIEDQKYISTAWLDTNSARADNIDMRFKLKLFATGTFIFCGLALCAQTPGADDTNKSQTEIVPSQSDNVNSTRVIKSHTQSGNRTFDTQTVQLRDSDGHFGPYQEIETETVKVNAATVRTTTRTFGQDVNGARTLIQETEEEKRTLPGGGSSTVSATSNPDADGRLQLAQRQIGETKKISDTVEESKTTVMLSDINGGLAPAVQVQERRQQGADNTIHSVKTTLLPDGNGNWQVGEVKRATIKQDGSNRTTDESVSRTDINGDADEVAHTVSTETESAPGETVTTLETSSLDVPGIARDGNLHAIERKTTVHRTGPTGQQTTEQRVQQPNPGDPGLGLRVTTVTVDTVNPNLSASHAKRTIQALDANDNLGVVSVDTTDTRGNSAVKVQIAPAEKPK
jgi:hypothetical protein